MYQLDLIVTVLDVTAMGNCTDVSEFDNNNIAMALKLVDCVANSLLPVTTGQLQRSSKVQVSAGQFLRGGGASCYGPTGLVMTL